MNFISLADLGWNHHFQSQLTIDDLESLYPFRVISLHRSVIECVGLDQNYAPQTLPIPSYYFRNDDPDNRPTVGDWMVLDGDHLPVRILSRKSLIKRKAAGAETKIQLIAANIDVLFVVTSCNDDFSLNRVERYLTIANVSEIQCVVVLTKTDLCSDAEVFKRQLADAHPEIPVECVNATNNTDLDRLNQWIGKGQTAALLGSSGVGKSTIINGLQTGSDQRTGAIREHDGKGRHTTTSRSLHRLSHGGLLIDTPGMRELQIVDSEQGIRATFHEIDAFAERCRFHNCSHTTEPGCAVLRAVESGDLDPRLLENYQKIMAEQDRNNQSLAERRSSDRALSRFYKTTQKGARKFKSRE